eukprot:s1615_g12.t1
MLSGATQPLRVTDLRARLHELVTASDASESGGGMVYGHKLSMRGLKEGLAIEEGWDEPPQESEIDEPQVILVFDFFAGIGGLSRSLQLAGVEVAHLVVIENDASCRRLNAVRWPGCEILTDIEKVTKKQLEKIMRSVPGLTGVIAGGGSPCQGLSQLSANRKHLADPRSQLFYKLCAVLGWIDELCNELQVWNIDFVENVVGDGDDVREMSEELGSRPLRVCSSGLSWVRRPRLYWSNVELEDHESFTRGHYPLWDELEFEEELEPLGPIADEGWTWPMGQKDSNSRLPTFTRAIPRKRPPAAPAGIASCSAETVMRWRTDSMKYPPYTYKDEYLFESKETPSLKRVASANERKRQLSQKELEEEEAVMTQPVAPKNAEWLKLCGHPKAGEITADPLSVRLILQYLRRMEYRGSDIRLDLGVIFKGDTVRRTTIDPRRWLWKTGQSYRWGHKEHINLLELRAVLRSLEWRARKSNFHSCRFMHLSDSQIVLAVLTKGVMPRVIPHKETKAERRRERQKIGRLSDQKVSPGTKERYATTLRSVASSLNLSAQALLSRPDLEDILCSYIEKLWEDGETRTFGSYALAAVQFYEPTLRGKLKEAWKLMGLWQKLEQPRRATPMDPAMLFAFAGTFWNWRWEDLACLTVVGFSGLLRTGEMFGLKRSDVVLSRQSRQASILFLYHTKTAQRKMVNSEKVLIYEQCAQACLRRLCKGKSADDFLVDVSPAKYRSLWKDVVSHLRLEKFHYLPYSLRRGGATSAHREGMSYDQLLTKGRWQSLSTAQLYVDQATQELAALQLPMDSISRIRAAQRCFKAAGLGRVEGVE